MVLPRWSPWLVALSLSLMGGRVTCASGPSALETAAKDAEVRDELEHLLPKYPGVRSVRIEVDHGLVTLEGHVENGDVREGVTQFTRRVDGARLVLNRMKTDAQVLTAWQFVAQLAGECGRAVAQGWLLVLIALAFVLAFVGLARLFGRWSEVVLGPVIANPMLRSLTSSLVSSLLVLIGILVGLAILNLTHLVVSIVGLAGVASLVVGFAFRDIAENYLASVLLATRRPFQIGDSIAVAGQSGIVLTLNTRSTVLVTLEGKHVRIPNNIIYKEVLVNSSASSSVLGTFDVTVPYEASTAAALEAITAALTAQEGVLPDPAPRALVAALDAAGVRLQVAYWMPARGLDAPKLLSDLRLKVKVALQQAGVIPSLSGRADANLQRDQRAADTGSALSDDGNTRVVAHVQNEAETALRAEGKNLLAPPATANPSGP